MKILTRVVALTLIAGACGRADTQIRTVGVGFFEGGPYPAHSEFRNQFREQLQAMTPSGVKLAYFPDAFKSADWNRNTSRAMARELTADSTVDLVVAIGPWTVEDLLAAGYDRPIIAALRFDPFAEGLVDSTGRSVLSNVTVRLKPRKVEADFAYLADLLKPDTVGVLFFPSGSESGVTVERMRLLGGRLGFTVVTAEGFDPEGAFAFFKAYRLLNRKGVDALYLPPLWGLDPDKIHQFYAMTERDGIATLSSEGFYHVSRGALAGGSAESPLVEAHYQAWKAARIIEGRMPADLPNVLADSRGLNVNGQVATQLGISVATDRRYDITLLEGPAADSVDRLTVIDAVSNALSQNQGYLSIQETLAAAEQAASKARASYLPQLELDARAAYSNDNAVNNDSRYSSKRYRAGLNLSQELFSLSVLRDIHSASLERDQSGNAVRQAALDLELAVTTAFLDLGRIEQIRQVEQKNLRQMQEFFQIAGLRQNLSETDAADVWRCEQEWLDALRAKRRTECEYRVASILLNTLLGRPGDYPFVSDLQHFTDNRFFMEESILTRVGQTPKQRERIVSTLVSLADSTSPEISGSELDADLQRSRLSRVNADFYPRVGFFATFDLTDELADRPGFEEANPVWSMGARLTLPLFSGGRQIKERRQMQAELERRLLQKDETNLRASSKMRSLLEKVYSRAEEFPMAARAAELAGKCVPDLLARYSTGNRTLLELLDATRNDRFASQTAIAAQIDYFTSVAELMRTVGISAYESGRTADEELMSRLRSMQSDSGQ
jgi:outer membrane protein